jgi:glutamate synthase domain-containing protein 3
MTLTPSDAVGPDSVVSIPEVRDYQRINAELVQRLDQGQRYVRLAGAEGQRLLAAGLAGSWSAVVEVEGNAGPELAAELDAPGLTLVARGTSGDGAGARLRAGTLILLGETGVAVGYAQQGGTIVAARSAGHRAGLNQRGGILVVLGALGRLAGERQSGGRLFALAGKLGPHAGHGRRGGALVPLAHAAADDPSLQGDDAVILRDALRLVAAWAAAPPGPAA